MSTNTPTGHDSGRTSEMSTTICRIPVLPFANKVKAGQTGPARRPLHDRGEIMPQYLVAIHRPNNDDPSTEGEAIQLRSQSEFTG
jgi:hypothetical protein